MSSPRFFFKKPPPNPDYGCQFSFLSTTIHSTSRLTISLAPSPKRSIELNRLEYDRLSSYKQWRLRKLDSLFVVGHPHRYPCLWIRQETRGSGVICSCRWAFISIRGWHHGMLMAPKQWFWSTQTQQSLSIFFNFLTEIHYPYFWNLKEEATGDPVV